MVCVAAVALGSSTYAWFVTNTKVKAGTVEISATTANTLLIKNENNEWATTYTFKDENKNFVPVSTIGKNSTEAFDFFIQNDWAKDTDNKITVNKVSAATGSEYWTKDFEIKASQACKLYLDTETAFNVTGTNNTTLAALSADGINKAVSGMNKAETTDTFGTPSANNIVSAASKALTGENRALATPDPANGLSATVGQADELYSFTENNEVVKIKAYIWMEGCDYDCNNSTVNEITGTTNKITATLGFCAGSAQ